MTIQNARFPIVAGCIFAVDAYPYTDEDQHSGDPMTHLYYRPTTTMDPEERLEDAALHKALHDTFGKGLTILATEDPAPEDGLFLGRGKMGEWGRTNIMGSPDLRYWEDPAFRDAITRSFKVTDLAGAEAEVSRLHEAGHDAFLKSTRQKHYTGTVPRGTTLHQALGAMAFSFMDRDNCLMVQEAVKMKYERRFLIMNGDVVTQSPVAWHLTPMSRARDETGLDIEDMHFETPRSNAARFSPKGRERMTEVARAVAAASETPHLCIDLAIMGDPAIIQRSPPINVVITIFKVPP